MSSPFSKLIMCQKNNFDIIILKCCDNIIIIVFILHELHFLILEILKLILIYLETIIILDF